MADLFPSRAQSLGVKPKVLLARTQKSLSHYRAALAEFAAPYIDIDNSVQGALEDLMAAFDDFERHVRETATWLNEQPGT
jgi:hypothetical protein